MQDAHGVVRLHTMQNDQRKSRQADIHKRFLKTSAETPDARQNHVHPAAVNGLGEGAVKTFAPFPVRTCPCQRRCAAPAAPVLPFPIRGRQ